MKLFCIKIKVPFLFLFSLPFVCFMSDACAFIPSHDPRLCLESTPLSQTEIQTKETQEIIQQMLSLAKNEANPQPNKKAGYLLGLAAPQVGILKQIIIIDSHAEQRKRKNYTPQLDILINPKIIKSSAETSVFPNKCYSVPEQFSGLVSRPKSVTVEAFNERGEALTRTFNGLVSHIVQHEIDHLLGIRFPERLTHPTELHLIPEGSKEKLKYAKNWKKWANYADQEIFEQLQNKNYKQF